MRYVNLFCEQLNFSVFLVGARGHRIDKFQENTDREELLPGAEAATLFYVVDSI